MLAPDLLGGDEPFVGVRGRHADVDDRDVRPLEPDLPDQRFRVLDLGNHLDLRLAEQADDSFPGEHGVLRDDYAHGTSARTMRPTRSTRPPSAPTRSPTCTGTESAMAPSSSTSTRSFDPSDRTRTSA